MDKSLDITIDTLASELKSADVTVRDGRLSGILTRNADKQTGKIRNFRWPLNFDRTLAFKIIAGKPLATVTVFLQDRPETHFIFRYPSGKANLLLTASGDMARIHMSVNPLDIFSAFTEVMHPTAASPSLNINWETSNNGFVAFAAIVDLIRLTYAASLVERKGIDALTIDVPSLLAQLKQGAKVLDYRWMCTYLAIVFPNGKFQSKAKLIEGCEELVKKGFLIKKTEEDAVYYSPTHIFIHIAYTLLNPLPALLIETYASRQTTPSSQTLLFGNQTLWCLEIKLRKIELRCLDGLEVVALLQQRLQTEINDEPDPAGEPHKAGVSVKGASAIAASADKGSKSESAILPRSKAPDAPNPSRTKQPTDKAITATNSAQDPLICKNCGTKKRPDVNFCTQCGA